MKHNNENNTNLYLIDKEKKTNLDIYCDFITNKKKPGIKTGFSVLDDEEKNLYGGIQPALYVLGAMSSVGKTTFALQLGEQIATNKNGANVLYISLEQSEKELLAKGLSRLSYHEYIKDCKKRLYTTSDLLYKNLLNSQLNDVYELCAKHKNQFKHSFHIYDNNDNSLMTIEMLKQLIIDYCKVADDNQEKEKQVTRNKKIIIIDYLQLIQATDNITDKQKIDTIVGTIKLLSKKHDIPIILISSFNRDSYHQSASMNSFKESGIIEYSADVLLALQYAYLDKKDSAKNNNLYLNQIADFQQEKKPVPIVLKCLKNRNGNIFSVPLNIIHAYNFVEEVEIQKSENTSFEIPKEEPSTNFVQI